MRWQTEYVTQETGEKKTKNFFFTVMASSLPVLEKEEQIKKIKKIKERKRLAAGFNLSDLTLCDFLSRCT